jgi:hypothetical protein
MSALARSVEAGAPAPGGTQVPAKVNAEPASLVLSCPGYLVQGGNEYPTSLFGTIVDPATGAAAGEFRSVNFAMATPFQKTSFNRDSVQHHVFTLANGEIHGVGTIVVDDGEFAVLGGTGAYSNVIGTYHATITDRRRGGNQTATFTFQLVYLNQLYVAAVRS